MKRGSLLDVNPSLKDPKKFREFLIRNVATSTAIETGQSVATISKDLRKFLDAGMPPLKPRRHR
jgi:hypothetical protein